MPVTAKQMIAAMSARPMFSNSVLVNRGAGGLVRITFGEEFAGEGVVFHQAILMHESEAIQMAQVLLQTLAPRTAAPAPGTSHPDTGPRPPSPDAQVGEQFDVERRVPRFPEANNEYNEVLERLERKPGSVMDAER